MAAKGSRGDHRGLWVLLFLVSGLPALFSAMVLPFDPVAALPWVVASWTVAVISGYRIWRIDHPHRSAGRTLARGSLLVLSWAVAAVALLVIEAEPILLVVVIGVWLLSLAALGLGLWFSHRSSTDI